MTEQQIKIAHKAIKRFVRQYVRHQSSVGAKEDLVDLCIKYFERHIDAFEEVRGASPATFAMQTAYSCLTHESRRIARQKKREKIANFRLENARGEILDQKRTAALVQEALKKLPPEQVEILRALADGNAYDLAKKRGIALRTFDRQISAAKTAFIDIYQKLINERN